MGQSVLLHTIKVPVGLSQKLHNPWIGPFYITNIELNNMYKLRKCSNHKELKSPVHANRLKPYDDPQHRPSLNPPPQNEPRDDNHVPPQQRLVQHHQNNHQHLNRPNQPQLPPPLTSLVHRPQNKDTTLQPNNPDDQYYVEKLLRYKSRDGKKFFSRKMAWSQWRTWEPEENLPQIMVKEFLINKTQKGTARKKSSSCFCKWSHEMWKS